MRSSLERLRLKSPGSSLAPAFRTAEHGQRDRESMRDLASLFRLHVVTE